MTGSSSERLSYEELVRIATNNNKQPNMVSDLFASLVTNMLTSTKNKQENMNQGENKP